MLQIFQKTKMSGRVGLRFLVKKKNQNGGGRYRYSIFEFKKCV